jgi:oligopeptide/dipeptide ABC transporter ATP-binding protein
MLERIVMHSLLEVRDLTVCYRPDGRWPVVAVDELSFDIAAGEAVGLLGESGCGKTTLGLTLLRLFPTARYVTSGSVVFEGTDLLTRGEHELRHIRGARISMVQQEPGQALNPVIRVGDQIAEVIRAHNLVSLRHSTEEAKLLLTQVGFEANSGIDEAYPHQLSGGQKQRVVIAQAIACRPALIIADEPTTALDAVTQSEILTLLKNLQKKLQMALLLIHHDPGALEQVVDRILVMYAGRLVEVGPTHDVLLEPLHPYTRGLLRAWPGTTGTQNHRQLLPVIPGEPPDLAHLTVGCPFEPRCPDGRRLCRTRRPQELPIDASRRVACVNYAN